MSRKFAVHSVIFFTLLLKNISTVCMLTQINLRDLNFDDKKETVINKSSELKVENGIYIRHNPEKVDTSPCYGPFCDLVRSNFGVTHKKHCTTTYFRPGDSISFDDDTILKKLERKLFEIKPKNSSGYKKACVWYYRPLSTCESYSVVAGLVIFFVMLCKFVTIK
ncbi:hypothetical protein ACFLYA_00495 [Candidatus Dependentiae bacterium]